MIARSWLARALPPAAPLALAAQGADSSANAVKVSGYVTSSYVSASKPTGRAIVGRLYDRFQDQVMLNAVRISLEKPVATDKFDAGFRVDALFGQNAPQIWSNGLHLGDQGDLPQAFVTLNVVEAIHNGKSFMGRLGVTPSDQAALAFLGYYGPEQPGNTRNKRYGGEFIGTFKPASAATLNAQFDAGGEQGIGSGGADAKWWGAGLWGAFDLDPKLALALRGDYIDDRDGVRTSVCSGSPSFPAGGSAAAR
jgi:hypothetical protein